MSKLSIQSALITAVAIAGFAVGRSWPAAPADDRAYYVKAIEGSLAACLEKSQGKGRRALSPKVRSGLALAGTRSAKCREGQGRQHLRGPDFGVHSLRAGFLTSAARRGASVFKTRDVSRHKSMGVLQAYVRDADLFRDHAGAGLL